MTIGKDQGEVFLGKEISSREIHSEDTAKLVDNEIRALISDAYNTAKTILSKHRSLLDAMSQELQDKETLNTDDIFTLILDNLDSDERAIVQSKYERAKEMRFEYSADGLSKPVARPEPQPSTEIDDKHISPETERGTPMEDKNE